MVLVSGETAILSREMGWVRGRYEAVFGPSNRVQQSHPARLRAWVSGQGLLARGEGEGTEQPI